MSLAKNKESLFGSKAAAPSGGKAAAKPVAAPRPAPAAPVAAPVVSQTAGITINTTTVPTISIETKRKKIAEAQEASEKGMAALRTSMFSWKPDHLAAATYFEKSAECYLQAGDTKNSLLMLLQAADAHEHSGALAAVALTKDKAAKLAKERGSGDQARALLLEVAEAWGIHGDLIKYGETIARLAKEEEDHDPKRAVALYNQAIERICPQDTAAEQLGRTHVSIIDLMRSALAFFLRSRAYPAALVLAKRMAAVLYAMDIEASANKAMLAVTVLQLTAGDAVAAQRDYLESLSCAAYLRSKECELADLLVLAFVNRDMDQLETAQRHPQLAFLDRETAALVKALDIFNEGDGASSAAAAAAPSQKAALFSAPPAPSNSNRSKAPASAPAPPAPPAEEDEQDEGVAADLDALVIGDDMEEEEDEDGHEGHDGKAAALGSTPAPAAAASSAPAAQQTPEGNEEEEEEEVDLC